MFYTCTCVHYNKKLFQQNTGDLVCFDYLLYISEKEKITFFFSYKRQRQHTHTHTHMRIPVGKALLGSVNFFSLFGTSIVYLMIVEPMVEARTLMWGPPAGQER